jgi:hypothetical protein
LLDLGLFVLGTSLLQHGGDRLYAGPFGVGVHVHARQYSESIATLVDLLHGADLTLSASNQARAGTKSRGAHRISDGDACISKISGVIFKSTQKICQ